MRHAERYPSWPADPDSAILRTATAVYESTYGKTPEVGAFHAGLECGVIGEAIGGMDMISFGPDLQEVHTPNERLHIRSTQRTFELLVNILKAVATQG